MSQKRGHRWETRKGKVRSWPWTKSRGSWMITCWKVKVRMRSWTRPRGSRTVTCWKVEVKTLDWAERVTNYHVLKSWGRDLVLQRVTSFLLKGWDLDDIEMVTYHYEVVTLIISSGSHTITHRRTTCDCQNLEEHFYKCESL